MRILKTLLLTAIFAILAPVFLSAQKAEITGNWAGGTDLMGGWKFLQARFQKTAGGYTGSIDLPGLNARRLPLINIVVNEDLHFVINSPRGNFEFNGKQQNYSFVGTLTGPDGVKMPMHMTAAFEANDDDLKKCAGVYKLDNGQRIVISYSPLNMLDAIVMEDNSAMAITRLVGLIPSGKDVFITSKTAIARPGEVNETVHFDMAKDFASGLQLTNGDGKKMNATRIMTNYREEQVNFTNGNIHIGGTLFLPVGEKQLKTAIVVLQGAGPTLRTNPVANLKARTVAEMFGVAVLICDKRGTGNESGSDRQPNFTEMAADALASVMYLKQRKDIQPSKVGLIGQSESGWTVPIAAQSPEVAFAVIGSGSPLPNEEIASYEIERSLQKNKFSESDIQDAMAFTKIKWDYAINRNNWSAYETAVNTAKNKKWFNLAEGPLDKDPAHWNYMRLESMEDRYAEKNINKMSVPLLLFFGNPSLDEMIPVQRSKAAWLRILESARYSDYTIKDIPASGHAIFLKVNNGQSVKAEESYAVLGEWLKRHGYID